MSAAREGQDGIGRGTGVPPVVPHATYRLQFHGGFRLPDALAIVPYLHALGVSHLYASPLLRARSESTHGYDSVDPRMLDPERGGARELEQLVSALRSRGMGLMLDIVPNHMAASHENPAWNELLMHGRAAPRARWFDVDWYTEDEELHGRVMVPVLGKPLGTAIGDGELRLELHAGRVRVRYWDNQFPLDPRTVPRTLHTARAELASRLGAQHPAVMRLRGILRALHDLPPRTTLAPGEGERRQDGEARLAGELDELATQSPLVHAALEKSVESFGNGPKGHGRMLRLLRAQAYELTYWRRAAREINYRRFFNIDELVALRAEREWVFEETHALILDMVGTALVDALRVDHVDGLRDPRGYLERLVRRAAERRGAPVPVWVEKILAEEERLREDWPTEGTTGYEALNELESLFVDPDGERRIVAGYEKLLAGTRGARPFGSVAHGAKRLALATSLAADLGRLTTLLERWYAPERREGAVRRESLERAIAATIAALPVYRTYVRPGEPVHPDDRRWLESALASARSEAESEAVDVLEHALLPHEDAAEPDHELERSRSRFVDRFQQVTGPAAAKGVEDTALYRRVPLASLCEVGGEPDRELHAAVDRYHEACGDRAANWPRSMVTVTTHDTKRSADVRARLDALAAMPDDWLVAVRRWRSLAAPYRTQVKRRTAPDVNTGWLFWQTLLGVWPVTDGDEDLPDRAALERLVPRVCEYLRKAVREARERSSWVNPDEAFESAVDRYVEAVLDPQRSERIIREVHAFARRVAPLGRWISLSRTLLQVAGPGIPDVYQGDELWNLTLVDPDNRGPVDFVHRAAMLGAMEREWGTGGDGRESLLRGMLARPADGRLKMHVLRRTLEARASNRETFVSGNHMKLEPAGRYADALVSFARESSAEDGFAAVVVATRLPHLVVGTHPDTPPPTGEVWERTAIELPSRLHGRTWRCALTGREFQGNLLPISTVLHTLPLALLLSSGAKPE